MQILNLPTYSFKIKFEGQRKLIFDEIRKKYIVLSPEEWVRQNFVRYLTEEKHFPASLIAIETEVKVNKLSQRSDIVLYDRNGKPLVIVECKSHTVKINQDVFDQIARYNIPLRVAFLIVTNGLQHFCCRMDYTNNSYSFIKEIPDYNVIGQ